MKLVFSSNNNGFKLISCISRHFFYSTKTTQLPSYAKHPTSLYKKVSFVSDPEVSVTHILNEWVNEGKRVSKGELVSLIKQFGVSRRYKHALEVSQWMSDQGRLDLTLGDMTTRMDLISKVYNLEAAEKYFNRIPSESKSFQMYFALLNCYNRGKSVEKAESLMQTMKKLGYAKTCVSYNTLLNLYFQVNEYEKLHRLMEEMKEKGICFDKSTYTISLSACAGTSDVIIMEKLLEMIEADRNITMDWKCYAITADGYRKAGKINKALKMLKKSERLITGKTRKAAYEFLLTVYAETGRKDELFRIWDLYKSSEKLYNSAYISMVQSLLKLNNIDEAEKIFQEWESGGNCHDFRIPYLMICAYCNMGSMQKAEACLNKTLAKGKKPFSNTWDLLAAGYHMVDQVPKAVEAIKKGILSSRPDWKPNCNVLTVCIEYLEAENDAKGAEEFRKLMARNKESERKIAEYNDEDGSEFFDDNDGVESLLEA